MKFITLWLIKSLMLLQLEGSGVLLVGDRLFTDDPDKLRAGISEGWSDAVLLRPHHVVCV